MVGKYRKQWSKCSVEQIKATERGKKKKPRNLFVWISFVAWWQTNGTSTFKWDAQYSHKKSAIFMITIYFSEVKIGVGWGGGLCTKSKTRDPTQIPFKAYKQQQND